MTYMGTSTGAALANKTNVHKGDVWILTQSYTTGGVTYPAGSMAIAQGTEVNGVIPAGNVTWDFVDASGQDTTYTATAISHGIKFTASTGGTMGQLTLVAGNAIELTDSASSGNT